MISPIHPSVPRIVVIGSASVGKTSLISRIISARFEPLTSPTTGTAFHQYKCDHPIHPEVQLWDTAGMERFRSLNNVFYREAIAAILVFDLTNYTSFQELGSWLGEFIANAQSNPVVVLCGNKCDLGPSIEVDQNDVTVFCQEHGLPYYQTSALSGNGVAQMIHAVISAIPAFQSPTSTELIVPEQSQGCC